MEKELAVRFLQSLDAKYVAMMVYTESDVMSRAKERGIEITAEQAAEILDTMDRRQDCNIGMTWDTMDVYLNDYR